MSSWIEADVDGKQIVAKVGGYEGKKESPNPVRDIMNPDWLWMNKQQSEGFKEGEEVELKIGDQVREGEIKDWGGKGAKAVYIDNPFDFSYQQAEKLRVKRKTDQVA